jgi:hypothetical protein
MRRIASIVVACSLLVACGQLTKPPEQKSDPAVVQSATKMLDADAIDEISVLVRSGFYDKARLTEIFCEEMYEPGELESEDVSAAIDEAMTEWESDKETWPSTTDCDRLDAAFAAMNGRGLIALQNSGYTQSDGYDEFCDAYEDHPNKSSVKGYCFYHGQDLERAVQGSGLFFAFGPVDPKEEETKGPEIGRIVREELERVGLKVDWDGTFAKRMSIPNLVWRRR